MGLKTNNHPMTVMLLVLLIFAVPHGTSQAAQEHRSTAAAHAETKENSPLNLFRQASERDSTAVGRESSSNHSQDSAVSEQATTHLPSIPWAFSRAAVRDVLFPGTAVIPVNFQAGLSVTATDRRDCLRMTPFQKAVRECRTDTVRTLLAEGADVNEGDMMGRTALHFAASRAHLGGVRNRYGEFLPLGEPMQLIKTLLAAGANVNQRDNGGRTALYCVASQSGPRVPEVIDLLLNAGADIEARNNIGDTPLHVACLKRWPETAKVLLAKGANVNTRSKSGFTPLISATALEFTLGLRYRETDGTMSETVKILLDAGADVNARTKSGLTAFGIASKHGKTDVAELLRAHGAKE